MRGAKPAAADNAGTATIKRTLRVLQRQTPISAVAAMRTRRQGEC